MFLYLRTKFIQIFGIKLICICCWWAYFGQYLKRCTGMWPAPSYHYYFNMLGSNNEHWKGRKMKWSITMVCKQYSVQQSKWQSISRPTRNGTPFNLTILKCQVGNYLSRVFSQMTQLVFQRQNLKRASNGVYLIYIPFFSKQNGICLKNNHAFANL